MGAFQDMKNIHLTWVFCTYPDVACSQGTLMMIPVFTREGAA